MSKELPDWVFAIVVTLVLIAVAFLTGSEILSQRANYDRGIKDALASKDHAAVIAYSKALDTSFTKTSSVLLGFILVFTGVLYVLRRVSVDYRLSVTSVANTLPNSLSTTSPGLVIVTLGVVLISIAIMSKPELSYEGTPDISPNSASETTQTKRLIAPTKIPPSQ